MAKKIIHWTYEEFENQFLVQALHVSDNGVVQCFTVDETTNELVGKFTTKDEAIHFAEQTCKPKYYKRFSAGYELKYCDVDSDEWKKLSNIFTEYMERLVKMYNEEIKQNKQNKSFLQKLKEKMGSLFKLPKKG